MAKKTEKKTNAMRELERAGVTYQSHFFECNEAKSGVEVAKMLNQNPEQVFKTLVTQGKSGKHYVFMIPVAQDLDLKKAANAAGEKAVSMIKQKELLPLTGYVHGGCSPLAMKTQFVTFIDETAELFETILFSGGKIGCQIETSLDSLSKAIQMQTADLTAY